MNNKIINILICLCFSTFTFAQTPAFPGAEGGGMNATGGRGGKVIYVTSLADSGTGTLRAALNESGARTIVFKVSGIIELKSTLKITKGDVTIAGQTAPGDGICLKDYEMQVDANNVIIRFLRFRLGDKITTHEPDALWGRYKKNVIIDHCSVSWSIDECASFYSNENFTMQWCFITESMNQSLHEKGNHGYGAIWGGKNASFHHNLLAHHNSRNPRFNGWKRSGLDYVNPMDEERVDFRNNVIYNWGDNSSYGGESLGKYNIVANYFKYGPGTKSSIRSRITQIDIDASPSLNPPGYGTYYITGNYVYGNQSATTNNWNAVSYASSNIDRNIAKAETPFTYTPITQHTAEIAFKRVLDYGGASLVRDAVDKRVSEETYNGSYTYAGSKSGKKGIIDSQQDVGGWPAYNQGTVPADSDNDGIPDGWLDTYYPGKKAWEYNEEGYTYLEVYLNSLVEHITRGQLKLTDEPDDGEEKIIFCGNVPTDKIVPEAVANLVTQGSLSIADGRTSDGCSDNGYAWRTSDVTFTLPAKSVFSADFTSNGGRTIIVTLNGDQSTQKTYDITKTSCQNVEFTFDGDAANTIRIESFSAGDPMQFSMINLCIKEITPSTISNDKPEIPIRWTNEMIYANARKLEIFNMNAVLLASVNNVNTHYIGNLKPGVYIVRITDIEGNIATQKIVKY
jgi:hypothetical protein